LYTKAYDHCFLLIKSEAIEFPGLKRNQNQFMDDNNNLFFSFPLQILNCPKGYANLMEKD
jgi:hypothetical protein